MPSLEFVTLDVFTDTKFHGNPLAVIIVPPEQKNTLTQAQKQSSAKEFNLSETVFLHQPSDPSATTREVNIFTIEKELPFAGHPTVGSAYYVLHALGLKHVDTLLLKAGPFRITKGAEGNVTADVAHDVHIHSQTLRSILSNEANAAQINPFLSEDPATRAAELDAPVVSVVKGMSFVLVKLPSLEHLAEVGDSKRLDFDKLTGLLDRGPWEKSFCCRYYYVPTEGSGAESEGRVIQAYRTRMVELGFEDPATGSAASALSSYLAVTGQNDKLGVRVTQGVEMGRPSAISVDVDSEIGDGGERRVKQLTLGGTAVAVMKGTIEV